MKKMEPVSDKEFLLTYQSVFKKVFEYNQTFEEFWFSPTIAQRLIIYPQTYELDSAQLIALTETMSTIGDDAFVLTLIELFGSKNTKHWFVPIDDAKAYHSIGLNKALENAIYSPTGQWGIKFTMDQYAMVGGSQEFTENLKAKWPTPIDNQILTFLADFKRDYQNSGANLSWLKQFIEHVYGQKKSQELLSSIELM